MSKPVSQHVSGEDSYLHRKELFLDQIFKIDLL